MLESLPHPHVADAMGSSRCQCSLPLQSMKGFLTLTENSVSMDMGRYSKHRAVASSANISLNGPLLLGGLAPPARGLRASGRSWTACGTSAQMTCSPAWPTASQRTTATRTCRTRAQCGRRRRTKTSATTAQSAGGPKVCDLDNGLDQVFTPAVLT